MAINTDVYRGLGYLDMTAERIKDGTYVGVPSAFQVVLPKNRSLPIMECGNAGIYKTALVQEAAEEMGWPLVELKVVQEEKPVLVQMHYDLTKLERRPV